MIEVLVWMLVAASYPAAQGTTTVVGHFKTQVQCEHVRRNLPLERGSAEARCIQANILVPGTPASSAKPTAQKMT